MLDQTLYYLVNGLLHHAAQSLKVAKCTAFHKPDEVAVEMQRFGVSVFYWGKYIYLCTDLGRGIVF